MSQKDSVEVEPTTDADEETLDRALASGAVADTSGSEVSTSNSRPGGGPGIAGRPDGRPVARKHPASG
ncbi:hypothetical protein AQJ43_10620 [Streptomyces avermitilis]|uniref:Uncharacterized protein n=1 Tax=Streptomyces avermitilis TaxID=33903 RepID=A0A4D4N7A2_STRAX|nr:MULTISPECIES: hypothetical protein [Streptomyces]KUN55367.1 hypothetical protein AQJ43_10620 [Streptomyces avermitilis]MYS96812.1 hypothetical protein [Streptomyces sp. SID5469]OOV24494.1 hypothetical protein SM007_29980 [Streptomyces avermitilis]BBJ48823.1 hypothetical protein SAVMC3_14520 [Streptomyces avermitilis]GDY60865.1 hypothetical protein SAV14893_002580 [Streptomyces avermitilis]